MIWIDLKHKLPTDSDLPADVRWSQEEWDQWLAESKRLLDRLVVLDSAGDRDKRNKLIDDNSDHWGKLKKWLITLSGGKCWFSGAKDLYAHYDVEHFRPKKETKDLGARVRDGYWWLAFDYMNFRLCGNVGNRKKGGWFPLKASSLCSSYDRRCEDSESNYLLDPIDEYDVSLIAYDEQGNVIPDPKASEWEKERVKETVIRLKLNEHVPLADARRGVWQQMNRLIDDFYAAKIGCGNGDNPAVKERFLQIRHNIRKMLRSDAQFPSVAKWCLLFRNDHRLSQLVG